METELIRISRSYAEKILGNLPAQFTYHNLRHTAGVAMAAEEIGRESGLSEQELETVLIAAWLHDLGYMEANSDHHEETSKARASILLSECGAPVHSIHLVMKLIDATRTPQQPITLAEKVLCDADFSHLANPNIAEYGDQLRKELEALKGITFETKAKWLQYNIQFLKQHNYFTTYGQTVLERRKRENLKTLMNMLKDESSEVYMKEMEKELEQLRLKLDKKSNPARGIETMFRVVSENHITLSGMADTKSNIMISTNSIILSVVITVLFGKLEAFPYLLVPTLLLVTTCLVTIIFAILATRPQISSGKFTSEDIRQKKTNLLFFGNFHAMELSNYDWGLREMMKDADYLYGSLIKDIYFNGKVLARKYRQLRLSYTCFMFGFVASILGFTVVLLSYYFAE